jgi:hypothetical protein
MAIERQVPDPAQTVEPVQDLTTERQVQPMILMKRLLIS